MGMFDRIICEVPLPDGWVPTEELQTKSLEAQMLTYTIGPDGRLWVYREERQYREEAEPERIALSQGGSIPLLAWDVERAWHERVLLTGEVRFYAGERDRPAWHEYVALYLEGELLRLAWDEACSRKMTTMMVENHMQRMTRR